MAMYKKIKQENRKLYKNYTKIKLKFTLKERSTSIFQMALHSLKKNVLQSSLFMCSGKYEN